MNREMVAMRGPGAGAKLVLVHPEPESQDAEQLLSSLRQWDGHCAVFSSSEAALAQVEPSVVGTAVLSLDLADATVLARQLKEYAGEQGFVPVIAAGSRESIRRALAAMDGVFDDFVATPIEPEEFQFRLAALLRRRHIHAELSDINAELAREQDRRKALAALVVHDLRNPLSAMVGNIQLLAEVLSEQDDPIVEQCLGDLGELSEKTLSMVAGLLDVEEFEGGRLVAKREAVQVHGLVGRMPSFYKTATQSRRLELTVTCPEDLVASFDRQLIARILENLLDNAVRYAPRKGRVAVDVQAMGRDVVFTVGNNGPAIPEAQRERMFERYYRLESAKNREGRSNRGLGLYFCRLAAKAHGGTIEVVETAELPASFVLRLPDCVGDCRSSESTPRPTSAAY